MMTISFTNHACKRLAERRITLSEVFTAADKGSVVKSNQRYMTIQYHRLFIVLSHDLILITAYRELSIKKKLKKRRQKKRRGCHDSELKQPVGYL